MKLKGNRRIKILFCIISVALIWGIYAVTVKWVRWEVEKEKVFAANVKEGFNEKVLSEINQVNKNGKMLYISGWIMKYNTRVMDVKMVLRETGEIKEQVLKTSLEKNKGYETYLNYLKSDGEYKNGGFTAKIEIEELKKDACYEVLLYFEYEKKRQDGSTEPVNQWVKVATGQYLYRDAVYRYNPTEFIRPEFADEQMQTVIESGVVLAYDNEKQVWLYLYEENLYWILSKEKNAVYGNKKVIFYHEERYFEERQKYDFDNKDFYFETREVPLDNNEKYEVAKISLVRGYPITRIQTGLMSNINEKGWNFDVQIPMFFSER